MNKLTVLINLFFITFFINAQEKVIELQDNFSNKFLSDKSSYSISNQITGDLMLLLENGKTSSAFLLDSTYKIISKINAKRLSSKYEKIIGYNINNNQYSIFFSNDLISKIGVVSFDFDTSKTVISKFDFDFNLDYETFIETINYKNKLHVLTITDASSDINIYTFGKDHNPEKITVSLEGLEYPDTKNPDYIITADYLFSLKPKKPRFFGEPSINSLIEIAKIESHNPNVIETTSNWNKMYQIENQIVFSLDYDDNETKVCFINLDTFEVNYQNFDKPSKFEDGYKKTNSYIFENKIFQIASSKQKMKFTVSDLSTKKILNQYKITKEDSIPFKNSPIIQEGAGMFPGLSKNRIREMEKTSKYLRKISAGDLGISVYKVEEEYNIILGGTKEINSGSGYAAFGFGGGGTAGNSTSVRIGFDSTFYNYNGYTSTKSIYINCLFDSNFDHIEGDIKKNSYDRLFEFEDNLDIKTKAVNIFLHKNKLHYGFFDTKKRVYKLYQFKE